MQSPREQVANDPKYRLCLDHGFVGITDFMGSDAAIVEGARVSYGKGTKSVSEDRGLIRYLVRHRHTSPLELCEVKFRIRAPIFVLRQLFRHRTSSANEESARYSEMLDEFYIPDDDDIQPQSKDNKQGRAGDFTPEQKRLIRDAIEDASRSSYEVYRAMLGNPVEDTEYDDEFWHALAEQQGVARELARIVMPVNTYSTLIWKQNLHNLFHLLGLRADSHAQQEIRVYAEAMLDLIRPLFPVTVEAWSDYVRYASNLSRMETELTQELLHADCSPAQRLTELVGIAGGTQLFAASRGMSMRELREFTNRFGLVLP